MDEFCKKIHFSQKIQEEIFKNRFNKRRDSETSIILTSIKKKILSRLE